MRAERARAQSWYREPWPWILMAGPAIVVVAGLVTAWLAVTSDDGLVFDDYYKQGLAINRTLERGQAAERLRLEVRLYFADDRVRVLVGIAAVRGALTLRLAHPTRAGMDQSFDLTMVEPGVYEGKMRPLPPGHWHMVLETRAWRMAGEAMLPATGAMILGGHLPAPLPAGMTIRGEGKR